MSDKYRDIKNEAIIDIIDMLLAHQAMGRDLEEVINYLARTLNRRLKETQQ
jgi:hypothetical protein